jgi:hypothetical protein
MRLKPFDASAAIRNQLVPADWKPERNDDPKLLEVEKLFDDLIEDNKAMGREYERALDCADYEQAYRIANWFLDESAHWRAFSENIAAHVAATSEAAR